MEVKRWITVVLAVFIIAALIWLHTRKKNK